MHVLCLFYINLKKMSRLILTAYCICMSVLLCVYAENRDKTGISDNAESNHDPVNEAIELFELKASAVATADTNEEGVLAADETEHLHNEMAIVLEDIVDLLSTSPNNAYRFLKNKGVERVILPNLPNAHSYLRTQLLTIAKILFNIAPTTANSASPIFMVDKLLNIFETDKDVNIKSHIIDLLSIWLPNNPKVQARVMKIRGLDLFYNEIAKLDFTQTHSLLELFNNILKEHLEVRSAVEQGNIVDLENVKIYQRIGLIEQVSTPSVCKGLLNVFGTVWSHHSRPNDEELMTLIMEILKNLKPYCMKTFSSGKSVAKAAQLLQSILDQLKNVKEGDDNVILKLNISESEQVLEEYITAFKRASVKEDL